MARQRPWLPLSGELAKIFDFRLRGSRFLSPSHAVRHDSPLVRGGLGDTERHDKLKFATG